MQRNRYKENTEREAQTKIFIRIRIISWCYFKSIL